MSALRHLIRLRVFALVLGLTANCHASEGSEIAANGDIGRKQVKAEVDSMILSLASYTRVGGFGGQVEISPDGSAILYSSDFRDASRDTTIRKWQVVERTGPNAPRELSAIPPSARHLTWRPDGGGLAMTLTGQSGSDEIGVYDINSDTIVMLQTPAIKVDDVVWSPNGNFLAVTGTFISKQSEVDHRSVFFEDWRDAKDRGRSLFLMDVATGVTNRVTDAGINVAGVARSVGEGAVAWMPDSRRLVVTSEKGGDSYGIDTDLYIVDSITRKSTPLVVRPGRDQGPIISPDGRLVAFSSHRGDPQFWSGWPTIVNTVTGDIKNYANSFRGTPVAFSSNGGFLAYYTSRETVTYLATIDLSKKSQQPSRLIRVHSAKGAARADRTSFSFSHDNTIIAETRSSIVSPPEIFVTRLDSAFQQIGISKQVTHVNRSFSPESNIAVNYIRWKSHDGRHTIEGIVLKPRRLLSVERPLPTVVYFMGGPGMLLGAFAHDGMNGFPLVLASAGYVVLIPGSRGRDGYTEDLLTGIRDDRSYGRLPYLDGMAGLNALIEMGVSDPTRLAVAGHSYGGYLAAYATTQTDRFCSAIVQDSSFAADLFKYAYQFEDGFRTILARDLFGIHDPFSSTARRRLMQESPGWNAKHISTPILLNVSESKANLFDGSGRQFYGALRYYKVPSRMLVYDQDHVFDSPHSIIDNLGKSVDWVNAWTLDGAHVADWLKRDLEKTVRCH